MWRRQSAYFEGRKVRKALREISPDIVHAHGPSADYFASKETGISTVMNIHNKLDEDYVPLYGKLVGTITAKVDAESIKKLLRLFPYRTLLHRWWASVMG